MKWNENKYSDITLRQQWDNKNKLRMQIIILKHVEGAILAQWPFTVHSSFHIEIFIFILICFFFIYFCTLGQSSTFTGQDQG